MRRNRFGFATELCFDDANLFDVKCLARGSLVCDFCTRLVFKILVEGVARVVEPYSARGCTLRKLCDAL